jgi:hypothetical protein
MTERVERVVISLDSASEEETAIETAARLAAHVNAPLHGIFVEDEALLGLASLPFARQVGFGAAAEPLTVERAELQLRAAAERARQNIASAAEQEGVVWSFEVLRGPPESAFAALSERDLVVASALTRPIAGGFRVACRWWSSINIAPAPLLLARRAWKTPGTVLIILPDQGHGSVRLLEAAARIAEASNANLILVYPADLASTHEVERWAMEHLVQYSLSLRAEPAPANPTTLNERVLALDCRVLAITAGSVEAGPYSVRDLVERLACDLLVVR